MAKKQTITSGTDIILKELEKSFEGDMDLMLFYVNWLKNGLNSAKAYKELHPEVTTGSSEVLGSRMLSKVKEKIGLTDIMAVYGLNVEEYLKQLKEGILANKRDQFSGEIEPDHKTRLPYHNKLGNLLGIEKNTPSTQVNIQIPILGKDFTINVPDNNSDQKDS